MCPQVVGTIAMIPYTPSGSAPTSAPPAIQALIGNSTGRFLGSYVRLDCPVGYQLTYGTQKAGIDIYNCLASGAWNPSDIDQLRCKCKYHHSHLGQEKILFVSCNGLKMNRVVRPVKRFFNFFFALFLWSKMCFMHVLR